MTNWDDRHFQKAINISTWSKDRDTKVGCIIVDNFNSQAAEGYNGPPRGVVDSEDRLTRPNKYNWMVHAEANAIYQAARRGISLEGCTLYTTLFPCCTCAKGIIQVGIKRIVTPSYDINHAKYGQEWTISLEMLTEANIIVDIITTK